MDPKSAPNPSERDMTRKTIQQAGGQGSRTVSSFKGLDDEERELENLMQQIKTPSSKDPTEFCGLTSEKGTAEGQGL